MVYFSDKPIPPNNLKGDQFAKLQTVRDDYQKRGLYATFPTTAKLKELVVLHLTNLVTARLTQARAEGQPIPSVGTLTAPKPDVRVDVSAGVASGGGETQPVITVKAENHSPADFFFNGVSLSLAGTDESVAIMRDALYNQPVLPSKIASGDSVSVTYNPSKHESKNFEYLNAIVHDKIGRTYVAPPGEMSRAIKRFYEWKNVMGKRTPPG